MNEKLEQQLQADFPFMATNKADGEENLYRRYGCDCDDGWYGLIHDMCQAISKRYAEDSLPSTSSLRSSKRNMRRFASTTPLKVHRAEALP